MGQFTKEIYVDEEVPSQVLSIIRDAQKYVVVVSPWVKLWGHAETAFRLAFKNGVKVTVVVRSDPDILGNKNLSWLMNSGARVMSVDNLHAKIYFNESDVIVSSMNLLESSAQNSLEIAWLVRNAEASKRVRDYVANTIAPLAKSLQEAKNVKSWERWLAQTSKTALARALGKCIRCGRDLILNPSRPLCEEC